MKDSENKVPNANYRKDKIPKWINFYALLTLIFLIARATILYFEPVWLLPEISRVTVADGLVIKALGAANFMMAFLMFSAYSSQNSMFMVFGYMVNFVVNIQLLIILPYLLGLNSVSGIIPFVLVLFFVIVELNAIVQLRKLTVIPFEK